MELPADKLGIQLQRSPVESGEGNILDGGIGLVGSLVEQGLVVNSQCNVVVLTSVVKHEVRVDRDMAGVPGVGEPNSSNDGEGEESTKEGL